MSSTFTWCLDCDHIEPGLFRSHCSQCGSANVSTENDEQDIEYEYHEDIEYDEEELQ